VTATLHIDSQLNANSDKCKFTKIAREQKKCKDHEIKWRYLNTKEIKTVTNGSIQEDITDIIQDAGNFHELARKMQRGAKEEKCV
jgi:hypothetical protein